MYSWKDKTTITVKFELDLQNNCFNTFLVTINWNAWLAKHNFRIQVIKSLCCKCTYIPIYAWHLSVLSYSRAIRSLQGMLLTMKHMQTVFSMQCKYHPNVPYQHQKIIMEICTIIFNTRKRGHVKHILKKDTWLVECKHLFQPLIYLIIIGNRFTYMNNKGTKPLSRIPLDLNIMPGLYEFNLQATVNNYGLPMQCGHWSIPVNCWGQIFYCNDNRIAECDISKTIKSSTAYILMNKVIMECLRPDHRGWELFKWRGVGTLVYSIMHRSRSRHRSTWGRQFVLFLYHLVGLRYWHGFVWWYDCSSYHGPHLYRFTH